ncbi:MAG: hypothetical protein LUG93_04825 [Lachnospiraceae bacterium]|nr:hypothetical protein [Lachnospiraceae bacterium]
MEDRRTETRGTESGKRKNGSAEGGRLKNSRPKNNRTECRKPESNSSKSVGSKDRSSERSRPESVEPDSSRPESVEPNSRRPENSEAGCKRTRTAQKNTHRAGYGIPKGLLDCNASLDKGTNRIYAIVIWEQMKYSNYPATAEEICERVNRACQSVGMFDEPILNKATASRYLEDMVKSTFWHFRFRKIMRDGKTFYFCEKKEDNRLMEVSAVVGKRLTPLAVLDVLLDADDAISAEEIRKRMGGSVNRSTVYRTLKDMVDYAEARVLGYTITWDEYRCGNGNRYIRKYLADPDNRAA